MEKRHLGKTGGTAIGTKFEPQYGIFVYNRTYYKIYSRMIKNSVNLLHLAVSCIGEITQTGLYGKPTDSHQYLQANSCHPCHRKKVILYSQALKLNHICSEIS